jgi:Tfp pilus assembly protein PilZ
MYEEGPKKDLKIELKTNLQDSPECLKLDILNLSAIGAFIFGCNKFKLGDEVVLKMKLAPSPEVLELEARVVWVPDKTIQPHEYPGIGVEFSNLSQSNQQKLIEFIERNISSILSD